MGDALSFGDLTTNKREWPTAMSSPTRTVVISGEILTNLDTVIISSKGNAVEYGDLTQERGGAPAVSDGIRGVIGGGGTYGTSGVNTIDYIIMSIGGNATDFGDLTLNRGYGYGVASRTRGVFASGQNPNNPAGVNNIDYITIATAGDAIDFGDMSYIHTANQGACSDSHGGLGGF